MCGFVVVADLNKTPDRTVFSKQLDAIKQRGPDDFGIHAPAPNLLLGSRRLCVQDTTYNGHMPMVSADGEVTIVFNGEIYNFRELRGELIKCGFQFFSNSDTEVLLYSYIKWGYGCLDRLDGMFAFVVSDYRDPHKPKLFLARDKVGEKPLYWHNKNNHFVASSELSAILLDPESGSTVSLDSLKFYLGLGYIPAPRTIIEDAYKLEPAHYAIVDLKCISIEVKKYWMPPTYIQQHDHSIQSCSDYIFELLKRSVEKRLVSDVPLGVFLSGGIDSSLIVAAASQASSTKIKTFTISFPDGGSFDEGEHALIVANYFGTEHHDISFTMDDLLKEIVNIMNIMDEPLGDSSILPTSLLSRFTRESVTVALGGDGGDELFGGYSNYCTLSCPPAGRFSQAINKYFYENSLRIPLGVKGRGYIGSIGGKGGRWFSRNRMVFNKLDRNKILSTSLKNHQDPLTPEDYKYTLWDHSLMPADAAMRADFQGYLPNDILTKVDRASMAHSLEVRAPFLSNDIIDYAFSRVPVEYKVSTKRSKILLKETASKHLPDNLQIERKQGFSIPHSFYKSDGWRNLVLGSISNLPSDLFNHQFLLGLARRSSIGFTLMPLFFPIIMLSGWFQKYRV